MSQTRQPEWEFIGNLGDASPLEYGGYFVYRDKTGVYEPEAEWLEEGEERITVYRFVLERKKMVDGYLVPFRYGPGWPHPVADYDEWFHRDLDGVARTMGTTKEELEGQFSSADPLDRAQAYEAIGRYHGFDNLDSYPITISLAEALKRYRKEIKALKGRAR